MARPSGASRRSVGLTPPPPKPREAAARIGGRFWDAYETQQVAHGGVEVVDVDLVFHRLEAEIVAGAVDMAAFYAAAGHPNGEAEMIVAAAFLTDDF